MTTEKEIADLLKPLIDYFATGANRAILLEMHAYGDKVDTFRLGMWDTKNGVYHYGKTIAECQAAKDEFDPEKVRLAEIAALKLKLAALETEAK